MSKLLQAPVQATSATPTSSVCPGWPQWSGAPFALEGFKRVHFIGIGGVGMSGLARICMARGVAVSGSDSKSSDLTRRLEQLGARIAVGHAAANVDDCDLVIISSAIHPENSELVEANRRGLMIRRRGELLAALMRNHNSIAIAGAHGKTTTSAMTSHLIQAGELDPTLIVGGEAVNLGTNVRLGGSDIVVAEADESDGSFLLLECRTVVVTNIDDDHLDHYIDMATMESAYHRFVSSVGPHGQAVMCIDDPRTRSLATRVSVPVLTYGFSEDAYLRAFDVKHAGHSSTYSVMMGGHRMGPFTLNIPGRHNVLNSLAAIAVAWKLGVTEAQLAQGLTTFCGVKRRFQFMGEASGIKVFDDYAHHPTEIRATLASARLGRPRRVVAIFQPHRYSRTESLAPAFAGAFSDADLVMLLPIYSAGEKAREGVCGETIFQKMQKQHPCVISLDPGPDQNGYVPLISSQLEPGDWVLTVGAGDITRMGGLLLEHLRQGGQA